MMSQCMCAIFSPSKISRRFVCFVYMLLRADANDKLMSSKKHAQADVETDEVYAQMTLQPLNPVS